MFILFTYLFTSEIIHNYCRVLRRGGRNYKESTTINNSIMQKDVEKMETVADFVFWVPKSVTEVRKLEEKL